MTEVIYTFLQLSMRMCLGSHTGLAKRVLALKKSIVPVTIQLVLMSYVLDFTYVREIQGKASAVLFSCS